MNKTWPGLIMHGDAVDKQILVWSCSKAMKHSRLFAMTMFQLSFAMYNQAGLCTHSPDERCNGVLPLP